MYNILIEDCGVAKKATLIKEVANYAICAINGRFVVAYNYEEDIFKGCNYAARAHGEGIITFLNSEVESFRLEKKEAEVLLDELQSSKNQKN